MSNDYRKDNKAGMQQPHQPGKTQGGPSTTCTTPKSPDCANKAPQQGGWAGSNTRKDDKRK